ncbi:hypothetical protein FACS189440_18080 [Bacteroidia bacterium]|nr:hypothetical protein FACS189440_18080 [Bacteroidia bacterium]
MKATQILLLFAASLLMLAGCHNKKNVVSDGTTSDKEQFTMTLTGHVFSSYITAQSLTIDWGDGTTETFESCDKRNIKHTYKESESHTVTAITDNLTYLDCSGNQLTDLDVSKCLICKTKLLLLYKI